MLSAFWSNTSQKIKPYGIGITYTLPCCVNVGFRPLEKTISNRSINTDYPPRIIILPKITLFNCTFYLAEHQLVRHHLPDRYNPIKQKSRRPHWGESVAPCGALWLRQHYLLEVPDAVLAAEAFLLSVDQKEMVGWHPVGQVVATLLTAVHNQPVGPAVNVETRVAADLMGHSLKANLMPDL